MSSADLGYSRTIVERTAGGFSLPSRFVDRKTKVDYDATGWAYAPRTKLSSFIGEAAHMISILIAMKAEANEAQKSGHGLPFMRSEEDFQNARHRPKSEVINYCFFRELDAASTCLSLRTK